MSEKNKEILPDWINGCFIENSLKKSWKFEKSFSKIINYDATTAAPFGEHCGNEIKETSIIVKIIPEGQIGDFLRSVPVFETEGKTLRKVLPVVYEFLKKGYPNEEKHWPDCYYDQGPPKNIIIMEDLKLKEFKMADRFEGLDYEHSSLVVECLAKLHGTSIVMLMDEKNFKENFENYTYVFWREKNKEICKTLFDDTIKFLGEDMKTWPEFDKKQYYIEKLTKLDILGKTLAAWKNVDNNELKSLIHGDCWINNIMFKYDDTSGKKPTQMKFLDFQLTTIHSPIMDLIHFIFTSTKHDSKLLMMDDLLEKYHVTLLETFKKLHPDGGDAAVHLKNFYHIKDLKEKFKEKLFWGFAVLCSFVPFMFTPADEILSPDEFLYGTDNREYKKKIFSNGKVRKMIVENLHYFHNNDVI
ncbi:conserved hypothetical protein [Pediculus humanus corporis]|uniref:CHK kinase-like domain-containing protein n=1 Tax=Pediculus humanus subsp. corporis TaxID=121224 RepID=E0VH75_PEDHC|nr:uncharacterized protein Phum_PHUM202540 [Pediculus humanus corporis]EEB12731.1 conserved hypothetical protein [Pediculus humanus corporis]